MEDQDQNQNRQPNADEITQKNNHPKKRRNPHKPSYDSGMDEKDEGFPFHVDEPQERNRRGGKGKNGQPPRGKKGKGNYPPAKNENGERKNAAQNQGAKKKRQQFGGNYNHPGRGPEDLYGTPSEDDVLTMEELRAKIVLKAADGSIPAEENAGAAETAERTVEKPADAEPFGASQPFPDDPSEEPEEQVEVIGIRFRTSEKTYFFDPKHISLRTGDCAVVETARGPEFGKVVFGNRMVNKKHTFSPLRPVLRKATEEDIAHNEELRKKETEALAICQEKIQNHKLEMKLISAQYAFDNSKLLFYFTSEGRVDFRDLVRDLASVFRIRIELRQIGIRDEAKMLGGLGACGRPLCCSTFLPDFVQVSIKMAKEQNLSLNSAKISGVCGRMMCCLRYESAVYAEEIRKTPPYSSTVKTADGVGTVIGTNPLAGTVRVVLSNTPDAPPKQYSRDEVTILSGSRQNSDQND